MFELIIGIFILLLGIPIGLFVAKLTKEELNEGQKWFKVVIFLGILGAIASLYFKSDYFLFTSLFVAIATSMSLRKR